MQLSLARELGSPLLPPLHLTQPVVSPLPIAGDKAAALPSQAHLPSSHSLPKDGLTGQQDPIPTFPSSLRSHSSRQAGAGSSPGTVLYNTSSATAGERGAPCLPYPQQACEIVSSRAARSPSWSPSAPTHAAEEPLQPFPGSPCPSRGPPRQRQGWHHAGCTAARELAGRGEKVKREQPWRPGRRNGLGQKGRAPMGELCKAACSSQGQASTFFPLVSNCTQASPMCCPSYVPSSSL